MSSTVKEKIKVDELSKFGFKVGAEYVNFSKHLPEGDKTNVVPGAEFEAELFVADSGKRYLNKILGSVPQKVQETCSGTLQDSTVAAIKVGVASVKKAFVPKFAKKEDTGSGLSKEEWAQKDVRISRQGCIQAAVHALGPTLSSDTLFDEAAKLADQMLAYVNKKA